MRITARLGLAQLLHGDGEPSLAVHQLPVEVPAEPPVPDELAQLPADGNSNLPRALM